MHVPHRLAWLRSALIATGLALAATPAQAAIAPPYLELLRRLVDINTGTENNTGIEKSRALLIDAFAELGFFARVQGESAKKVTVFETMDSRPSVLLVGHLDTVFGPASKFQAMSVDDKKITGPGVIDMKGGLVLILNVLGRLKTEDPDALKGIRVVVNEDEETGSLESQGRLVELGRGIRYALVYEPGAADGAYATSLSGSLKLDLIVRGKAAHAGSEHAQGVNACVELGTLLPKLAALTDYRRRLTVSVGSVQGGTKRNIVCDEASAQIDIRYVAKKDRDQVLAKVRQWATKPTVRNAKGEATQIEFRIAGERASVPESSSRELFQILKGVSPKGTPPRSFHAGYVCDANQLAEAGLHVLVGLGPVGGGMHTEQEFLSVASYEERLETSVRLIPAILKEAARAASAK